jgi:nitroreductase
MRDRIRQICSKSGFLSSLYFAIMSRDFDREHSAVLSGINAYRIAKPNRALLRRNTHRLEKALVMRPRKNIFALNYISETVAIFVDSVERKGNVKGDELKWCRDVLATYFDVVGSNAIVDRSRAIFEKCITDTADEGSMKMPYRRGNPSNDVMDYERLDQLSRRRCSVRWFKQEQVPEELIKKALAIGLRAPSACNRQPFRFHFVTDLTSVKSVASLAWGTSGFCDNIPAVGIVIGSLRNFFASWDRHLIYIDSALAVGPFLLALETLGLSSCCLNWPDIRDVDEEMGSYIELAPEERIIMLIAIGYADPDGWIPYSSKKTSEEICRFNGISNLASS